MSLTWLIETWIIETWLICILKSHVAHTHTTHWYTVSFDMTPRDMTHLYTVSLTWLMETRLICTVWVWHCVYSNTNFGFSVYRIWLTYIAQLCSLTPLMRGSFLWFCGFEIFWICPNTPATALQPHQCEPWVSCRMSYVCQTRRDITHWDITQRDMTHRNMTQRDMTHRDMTHSCLYDSQTRISHVSMSLTHEMTHSCLYAFFG